jgi:hypothetical protein
MESINLIEDIQKTNVMEGGGKDSKDLSNDDSNGDVFIDNENGDSYSRYLELLDSYYKQSIKGKFTNDYEFFVDDDGNYVKNALDKKDETNNMVILKPKYINIKNYLEELNENIKQKEYLLRKFRTELLNNNNSVKGDFDSTLEEYNKLLEDRDSINNYNNKTNKIVENKDTINKLKLKNINLNLNQYTMMNSIKLREANEEEVINKYLVNNEAINSNNKKLTSLKLKEDKEFIVKEVFNNNTPVKKTIKFKLKKTAKDKKDLVKDEADKEKAAADKEKAAADKEKAAADKEKEVVPDPESNDESNDKLEEVDLSKKDKAKAKEKEVVPDPESNNESTDALEEVDLGLKAEVLDLGDDLEELQPMFDDGDEENDEYVFNKSGSSKGAEEDKNIPLKLDTNSSKEDKETKSKEDKSKESPKKETKSKDKESASGEEIDLDKLSKQLNKKVKDPTIKIIRIDPNLQFSNISSSKCDDSKTTRSDVETTNVAGGKKRKKKGIDPDLKNCMFPFKEGKGKKAVMHTECADTGIEDWCATERKEDCTAEKWAYCKSEL